MFQQEKFQLGKKNEEKKCSQWEWLSTAAGWTESLWNLYPWKYLKADQTRYWATLSDSEVGPSLSKDIELSDLHIFFNLDNCIILYIKYLITIRSSNQFQSSIEIYWFEFMFQVQYATFSWTYYHEWYIATAYILLMELDQCWLWTYVH